MITMVEQVAYDGQSRHNGVQDFEYPGTGAGVKGCPITSVRVGAEGGDLRCPLEFVKKLKVVLETAGVKVVIDEETQPFYGGGHMAYLKAMCDNFTLRGYAAKVEDPTTIWWYQDLWSTGLEKEEADEGLLSEMGMNSY
jgi:hypothetical protein